MRRPVPFSSELQEIFKKREPREWAVFRGRYYSSEGGVLSLRGALEKIRAYRGVIGMTGEFVKVKCSDCGNQQVIFDRASTTITCLICGATIAKPTGGKSQIRGEVVSKKAHARILDISSAFINHFRNVRNDSRSVLPHSR
jgi:small subunit ribosomal protein S27e